MFVQRRQYGEVCDCVGPFSLTLCKYNLRNGFQRWGPIMRFGKSAMHARWMDSVKICPQINNIVQLLLHLVHLLNLSPDVIFHIYLCAVVKTVKDLTWRLVCIKGQYWVHCCCCHGCCLQWGEKWSAIRVNVC